jgi:hypothetical protein
MAQDTANSVQAENETPLLLKNQKRPRIVTIGIQFDRIGEIDTINEKFYAELTIQSQWRENKIIKKYNPNVLIDFKTSFLSKKKEFLFRF